MCFYASHHFINLPRLPYLLNTDEFILAPPPQSPYAHGARTSPRDPYAHRTRDVDIGTSSGGVRSTYSDGSSDGDLATDPTDVFIYGKQRSPLGDQELDDTAPTPAGIFGR
jgi:hypothetical protein